MAMARTGTATASDNLYGTGADEVFDGQGAPAGGQDYAQGNGGADTFVFQAGYGQLRINEGVGYYGAASTATLQLGAGVTPGQVSVSADGGGNLFLTDGVTGDRVQIDAELQTGYAGLPVYGVAQVVFADGTTWTRDQLVAKAAVAAFNYTLGLGKVELRLQDGFKGLTLGAGIKASDVLLQADNDGTLTVLFAGSPSSSVTIKGDLSADTNAGVPNVRSFIGAITLADGSSISLASATGPNPQPLQFTWTGDARHAVLTGSNYGANTFNLGGHGNQVTFGSGPYSGLNTVNFATGAGTATINLNGGSGILNYGVGTGQVTVNPQGGSGSLHFGTGIAAANLVFSTDDNHDLFIAFSNSPGDSITVVGGVAQGALSQAGSIVFADGSTLTIDGTIPLLTPKIAISNIVVPAHALSGQVVPVTWTLTNQGTTTAGGPWSEEIFVASSAAGGNPRSLGVFTYQGAIGAGQSTTQTANVALPAGLTGSEWIVVKPNLSAQAVSSTPIAVARAPAPNLVVTSVTAPASGLSGQQTQVTWTVTNTGDAGTSANSWHDNVYLSVDRTLDTTETRFIVTTGANTDPLLASVTNPSYLAPGQSYTSTALVTLPQGISGPYYLIVGADAGGQVNLDPATPSSYAVSSVVGIVPSPVPDLQVSQVIAPPQAFSGQPLTLTWTVKNSGTVAASASSWTDQILVSMNGKLDPASVVIGTVTHTGTLAAGGSYTATATANLPVGVAGTATFFVVTDTGNQVYEGALRANNTGSPATPTNVALTPPPDLVTSFLAAPAAAVAGHDVPFSYKVTNSGATITPNTSWTDQVYVSSKPTLDGSAVLISTQPHQGALDVGESYVVSGSGPLPAFLSGPFYLIVQANNGNTVFELNTGNDVAASSAFTVASAPPALVVSGLTLPAAGQAGHQVQVAWQVTNNGTGDTAGRTWSDLVVLSASGVLGAADNVTLATVASPAGTLAAGAAYSRSTAVNLPLALTGAYTLFVVTEANPLLPTAGLSNSSSATQALTVTQQLADLHVGEVTIPDGATAGNAVAVGWTVTNAGDGPTDAAYWYDNVYLADVSGVPGVLLGQVRHVNALVPGASYTASATLVLPAGVAAGPYSIVVTADAKSQVTETTHANNAGRSTTIAMTANPNPAQAPVMLAVGDVVLPAEVISGQALAVTYTVTNLGSAATGGFYDAVYLSHNQALGSGSDVYLGYVNNTGLAVGASVTNTQSFTVPAGQSGPLWVIVKANAGATPAGGGGQGASPVASSELQVDLPAVVDLTVASVSVPATATVGGDVTIAYTVHNASANAGQGSWYDALYLSANGTWDPSDPVIGKVLHTGGVPGNGSYTETLTAQLPGVTPGNYEVIVRTNILSEAPGTNVTGVSAGSIAVAVPTLAIGTPTEGTLRTGQSAYYQFTVAVGETVDLSLSTDKPHSINNIYVRHGALPTPGQFDATSSNPGVANPSTVLRATQPGTYYVMVTGNSVDGTEGFELKATAPGFSVSHVTPDHGSNLGSVTLTVDGAKFNGNEQVVVVASDGTIRTATSVQWANSTEVWATFDLRGLAVGTYDVKVMDLVQGTAILAHAFQVTNGPAGQVSVDLVLPQYIRAGQTGVVQVNYANTGETDIAAPLIDLQTAQAVFNNAGAATGTGEVQFLGTATSGPAGILQPGAQGSVSFSYIPVNPQPHEKIGFTVSTMDPSAPGDWSSVWAGLQSALHLPTVGAADWNNIWAAFVSLVGTTPASVSNALACAATELAQAGQPTNDLSALIGFELLQATGSLTGTTLSKSVDIAAGSSPFSLSLVRTYSGTLLDRNAVGGFGQGWATNYDMRAVTDAQGNVFVQSPGTLHVFTLQADGRYAAQAGDAATLTASGGLYRMKDGSGTTEQFRADGKLASLTDGNGNVVSLAYTGSGVLSQVTSQATGETITLASDAQGRITSAASSRGGSVTYDYSADDARLLSATGVIGTASYAYAAATGTADDNALTSVLNPDGTQQMFTYNAQGWLASRSGANGAGLQSYAYDGAGRVTVTDALGRSTTAVFGANGTVAQLQDPLGNVTQVQSTAAGLTTKTVSAGGSTASATYDGSGNLTGFADPLGGTVGVTYLPGTQRLDTLTTQLGSKTRYSYDAAGNVTGITYQDSSGASYTYGAKGLLASSTDANGATTSYTYDAAGHLTKRAFADGTAFTYTYDSRGNLLTATAPSSGTTSYTYNAANRLLSVTDSANRVESYTYNTGGQLASRTEPDGSAIQYRYAANGQLAQLQDGAGNLMVLYSYDAAGQLTGRVTGNSASTAYTYDAAGRATEILNRNADSTIASRYGYTYDANSQVVQEATSDGTWAYGYDASGQLTTAAFASTNPNIANQSLSYTYDAAGNRVSQTVNGVTTAYSTNALNQYTQVGGTSYSYDADGRTITKTDSTGTTTFGYDADGHLVAETGPGGTFAYSYDALGNLASKSENGVATSYVNDPLSMSVGGRVLTSPAQAYGAGGAIQATYGYGLGLVSTSDATGPSYVNTDIGGNIIGVSGPGGAVTTSELYLPFGQMLDVTGGKVNPFGFSGAYGVMTEGNGLTVMRARAYDPAIGRFLSRDPLGVLGGLNLYSYVTNQPTGAVDPLGLWGAGVVASAGGEAGFGYGQTGVFAGGNASLGAGYFYNQDSGSSSVDGFVSAGATFVGQAKDAQTGENASANSSPTDPTAPFQTPFGAGVGAGGTVGPFITNARDVGDLAGPFNTVNINALVVSAQIGFGHGSDGQFVGILSIGRGGGAGIGASNYPTFTWPLSKLLEYITPKDPNDITGPIAFGLDNLVAGRAPLAYTVSFENASTATAPAQNVTITQQLDPNLDWTTFRLTGFGFSNMAYTLSGKTPFYTTQLDLTATKGYVVYVSAGVDVSTGNVTWHFNTVDPATGQAPADPTKGFLPVNDTNHVGDGYVSYTVQPKAGTATGTVIGAQASIVFDNEAPVSTPTITNTLVMDAPTSTVQALPTQTDSTTFQVSWSGQDVANGPGVASYTILVSQDGGPATPWLTGTTLTNALFSGQSGHTYAFSSVATDNVGITEARHDVADTTVLIGTAPPKLATGQLTVGHNQAVGLTSLVSGLITPSLQGDTETVTALSAARGTASIGPSGALAYTSPSGGTDTISFIVMDQRGGAATGTVAVTIDAGPVVTLSVPAKVGHGQTVQVGTVAPGLAGDALALQTTTPGAGTLSLAGGVLTYAAGVAGGPDSIGYTITDQLGDSVAGRVTLTADPGPALTPATAATVGQGLTVQAGTVAPGIAGDLLSLSVIEAGRGALALADGVLTYTAPISGGADSIRYAVTDQLGDSAAGTFATQVPYSDVLAVRLSEDSYQGEAKFSASVDGIPLGPELAIYAPHSQNPNSSFQQITWEKDFGAGTHDLAISFVNSLADPQTGEARHLYFEGLTLNGTVYEPPGQAVLVDPVQPLHVMIGHAVA